MSSDEQAIRDVVALWHKATADGNVETVLGLMADDAVFLIPGHEPMCGRAGFAQGLRQVFKTHRIESSWDIREVAVSGDLAYCWTNLEVHMIPLAEGQRTTRSGSALSIFRKDASGSWQMLRDANLLTLAA
jgi:uncharacterized protein (TIGR02246 family)